MTSFRGSPAIGEFDGCKPDPRLADETNTDWLRRQIPELQSEWLNPTNERERAMRKQHTTATYVVLVGSVASYDFRLRVAQSELRSDLSPSHFSHVFLLQDSDAPWDAQDIIESSLNPFEGFQIPTTFNGLQLAPAGRYLRADVYPNIAVIRVPVDPALWSGTHEGQKSVLAQFGNQRVVLDVSVLFLEWLAYLWCAPGASNPLGSGRPLPSAAVIEALLGACGYDLSPGLDNGVSSPEALWQTARWWQGYFRDMGQPQMLTRYCISHELMPDDEGRASIFQPSPSHRSGVRDGGSGGADTVDVTEAGPKGGDDGSADNAAAAKDEHVNPPAGGRDRDDLDRLLNAVDIDRLQLAFREPVANLVSDLRANQGLDMYHGPAMFASESRTARGFLRGQREAEQEQAERD